MWIKKTSVHSKKGTYTYIQLVHTERTGNRTHQKVLVNLGRQENLDPSLVEGLVRVISSGTVDSLPPEYLCLLPAKKYGISLLLGHKLKQLGIQRFLMDLAIYKKLPSDTFHAIFALLAYYSTANSPTLPFRAFLKETCFPFSEPITPNALEAAFSLLSNLTQIRYSLLPPQDPAACHFHYLYQVINDNIKGLADDAINLVITDSAYGLRDFRSIKESYEDYAPKYSDSIFISDSLSVLKVCKAFSPTDSRFICRVTPKELSEAFPNGDELKNFALNRGVFLPYKKIGYRSKRVGTITAIALRPLPGPAGRVSARQPETRDIIISTCDEAPEKILEHYLYLEKLQEYYFNIFLPQDLMFLSKKFSPKQILYTINNLLFIRFMCFDSIENQTRGLGLSAEEVQEAFHDFQGTWIHDGYSLRLLHTKPTGCQLDILKALDFLKPSPLNL